LRFGWRRVESDNTIVLQQDGVRIDKAYLVNVKKFLAGNSNDWLKRGPER
jgi:hypothetical protein